ncbi:HsdM family class I SAM-dependent methyltransferase [Corynebacterium aquatimens]|uniref:Type I restriction-modification system DNA methylase subunit n=1 Tax=Corynebacterium aquatimens TaxID=1190508 RepID=A0A931GWT9_9CORY|nr:N-6 DNA methylase [Corynebacterium aquatimens]MBG6123121.1 type I restriction-modification system DNA methylase subunit [Corynebacterium aquatimens]WJY66547.1 N-6 DNA Methylase [Corynebacterium aquatimens]
MNSKDDCKDLTPPPLGTSADVSIDELHLAAQIDALHQLIYARGGLNSTNAAIEEVEKLIYLRYSSLIEPDIYAQQQLEASAVFSTPQDQWPLIPKLKNMFSIAQSNSKLRMLRPDGTEESLWPTDEPFRLANEAITTEAIQLVNDIVSHKDEIADPIGTAFDAFLSGRYDHSGGLGTYLTPSSIARFMAEIAISLSDRSILADNEHLLIDPFCGTGRFLIAGYQALTDRECANLRPKATLERIVGADQSSSAISKSALNLILYGASSPQTFVIDDSIGGDTLDSFAGKFSLVLTNPPFGGGKYDSSKGIKLTQKYFPTISSSRIDPAIGGIARGLELLTENGVMAIVLPDGVVNGKHFQSSLRDNRFEVVASVSLPTSTFSLSGTVAKTSAVFIRKSAQNPFVVLARAEHIGFIRKSGKAIADPDGNDIPALTSQIKSILRETHPKDSLRVYSKQPLVASVPRNGLSTIDPNRFDSAALEARNIIVREGGVPLGSFGNTVKKRSARKDTGKFPFVSVLHVDTYGTVDWAQVNSYHPVTSGQLAESNDLLVSLLNPSKLRAAVVPSHIATIECSSEFGVFRGFEFPYAILALLHDPAVAIQLRPLGAGTSSSRRRISPQDVLDLMVPKQSRDQMEKLDGEVREHITNVEQSRLALHDLAQISLL